MNCAWLKSQTPKEHFLEQLLQDTNFIAAVRSGDVREAGMASWTYFKANLSRFIRDHNSQRGTGGMGEATFHTPRIAAELSGGAARPPRDVQPGEWVSVAAGVGRGVVEPELVGQSGQVVAVEAQGWVELHLPRLGPQGLTVRLQQKHLTPVPAGSPGEDLTGRQQHFEGYVRSSNLGQPLPPSKVSQLLGRGVSKARDVARTVRREVLALEELVPWELVEAGWRQRRSAWRKALRSMESNTKAVDSQISQVAAALLELHAVLLADRAGAGGAGLARGSAWEQRLVELAEGTLIVWLGYAGGNNYQCLQQVWEEMHEAMRVWLHSQGQALPVLAGSQGHLPPATITVLPPVQQPPLQQQGGGGYKHLGPRASWQAPGIDKTAFSTALTGLLALESGVAAGLSAVCPPLSQVCATLSSTRREVTVDKVAALRRAAYCGLRALLAREDSQVVSAFEALASSADLGPLLGLVQGDMSRLSDADVVGLLAASPLLRQELQLVRGLDSEPDTDCDEGDATDMDSD
ncbi:hypothetical protein QJQ45_027556 [Haematococcus lacustris]|nr:hypothetical protein QJQ45_027556 [Haematococcus lacustris]